MRKSLLTVVAFTQVIYTALYSQPIIGLAGLSDTSESPSVYWSDEDTDYNNQLSVGDTIMVLESTSFKFYTILSIQEVDYWGDRVIEYPRFVEYNETGYYTHEGTLDSVDYIPLEADKIAEASMSEYRMFCDEKGAHLAFLIRGGLRHPQIYSASPDSFSYNGIVYNLTNNTIEAEVDWLMFNSFQFAIDFDDPYYDKVILQYLYLDYGTGKSWADFFSLLNHEEVFSVLIIDL